MRGEGMILRGAGAHHSLEPSLAGRLLSCCFHCNCSHACLLNMLCVHSYTPLQPSRVRVSPSLGLSSTSSSVLRFPSFARLHAPILLHPRHPHPSRKRVRPPLQHR